MFDVFEQVRLAEEVAPPGFRIHYDFNHNRVSTDVLRLVQELEKSPTVGFLEDPLNWRDIDGWRRVIDFSGDSANNWSGPSIEEARATVLAAGVDRIALYNYGTATAESLSWTRDAANLLGGRA